MKISITINQDFRGTGRDNHDYQNRKGKPSQNPLGSDDKVTKCRIVNGKFMKLNSSKINNA